MRFTTATIVFAAAVLGGTQVLANVNQDGTAVEAREVISDAPLDLEAREPIEGEVDLEARGRGFAKGGRTGGRGPRSRSGKSKSRSRSRSKSLRRKLRQAGGAGAEGAAAAGGEEAPAAREFFDAADDLEARFIKKLWRKLRGKKKRPAAEELEARDFDDELEERDFDELDERDFDELDERDLEDMLEERDFTDLEDELEARFVKKLWRKLRGKKRPSAEEMEARDFDDELEERDFEDWLEERDFDDFEDLEARRFGRGGGRGGAGRRVGGFKRPGRGFSRGRRFGGAAAQAAQAAAPAERRDFEDDLEVRRFGRAGGRGGPGRRLGGFKRPGRGFGRGRRFGGAAAQAAQAAAPAERRDFEDDLEVRRFGRPGGRGGRARRLGGFKRPGRGFGRGRRLGGAAAQAAPAEAPAERDFVDDDLYERYFADFDLDEIDA